MKKYLIAILLAFSVGSCNFLDIEPEKSVTYTNYFKSEAEVEGLFFNMFAMERSVYATNRTSIHELMGVLCDEIYVSYMQISGNSGTGFRNLDPAFFMSTGANAQVSWKNHYDLIYLANMVIDNEYRFQNISKERADFWLAQAWFIKGLTYFSIARMWGEAPIMPNSEYKDPLAKSTAKDVLAEAVRCAEKALALPKNTSEDMVDSKGKRITSKQYASLGSVYTLLANIYAWMGGLYGDREYWEMAEKYASKVINNEVGEYNLEPIETLCVNTLGDKRQSDEVIFGIEINAIDRNYYIETDEWLFCPGQFLITYPVVSTNENDVVTKFGKSGDVEARIKYETVKNLYPESADKRLKEFWYNFGEEKNNPQDPASRYSYMYKWRVPIFSVNEDAHRPYLGVEANRVVWRLADLILLRAECRARLEYPNAVDDLDQVRRRAGLGNYSGGGDLRKEIFRERERELIGEGHRYYDAVRNGYFSEISEAMGALTAQDIERGAIYLPVSQEAFVNNSLMRQNTYWLWKK